MRRWDKALWQTLSPLLDRALDLDPEARAAFLLTIRAENRDMADALERLLAEHERVVASAFLETSAVADVGPPSLAGQTVGAYTLDRPLGMGGMGTVWLARRSDGRFEGAVAIKLVNLAVLDRASQERFRREGTLLARLSHPHIARLFDAGVTEVGQPFLVLEYVEGAPIDRYAEDRRLVVDARLELFLQVTEAVAHAHANLIVHRDLKPSNVLVTSEGAVKLLDFGIAKLLEDEGQTGAATILTREGGSALTPEYAAPEQVTGGAVSTSTDIYSLGMLLYVLLTGQHPAGAGPHSPADLMKAILDTEPPRLSDVVVRARTQPADLAANASRRQSTPDRLSRTLRGDLDIIVAKTLKKDPTERYASVTALADDLRRYLRHEPIDARPDTIVYRAGKFVRRNRTVVALASLTILALGAGLVGTMSQARRATAQAVRADQEARSASTQRDFALRQLSRAEAINDLNNFVLSDGATLGQRFSAGELLGRAEQSIDRQQGVAPEDRVELLLAIGYQYQSLDEHGKARELLTRAYELAGASSDRATHAKAACALASILGQAGEGEPAEQLLRKAEDELPDEPQFALHRVFCFEMGSVVAGGRGDAQVAVKRAESAQRVLKESRFDSALMDMRISFTLAVSYGFAGRWREAVPLYEAAFGRLASLGRDDTRTAGTILNNWGNALLGLGQPLQAERLFRRAIRTGGATEENATPVRLNNLARALRDLDRLSEAARYAELSHTKAEQMANRSAIDQALFVRASIYRQQGELQRTAGVLAELEPRIARLPAGHILGGVLASERAQLAQARGDFAQALADADRAVAIAEASRQAVYLPRFLARRSELAFQMDRLDQATADAEAAVRLEGAISQETYSNNRGLGYLALGRAHQAQGRIDQARAAFASAVEQLKPSLGEDHRATRSALQLAASMPSGGNR